jgi:hypothetical protein
MKQKQKAVSSKTLCLNSIKFNIINPFKYIKTLSKIFSNKREELEKV